MRERSRPPLQRPDIIKERLNKQASIGFQADLKDKYDEDKDILSKVTLEDLRVFGMVPRKGNTILWSKQENW